MVQFHLSSEEVKPFLAFPTLERSFLFFYPGKHAKDLHHRRSQRVLSKLSGAFVYLCFLRLFVLSFNLNISCFRVIHLLCIPVPSRDGAGIPEQSHRAKRNR